MVSGETSPNSRAGSVAADPAEIDSLAKLAAALSTLRGGRSYRDLDRSVGGKPNSSVLAASTLSDLLNAKSVPSRDTMVMFLNACGILPQDQAPWFAAWERVNVGQIRRPDGAVRVRDGQPRRLGVHASIQITSGVDDLPVYVPRDLDADLRTAITEAVNGGMVLVVGGSSVGKTRALFEAIRSVLPDWWLIHPTDSAALTSLAGTPIHRTVVWLDELQRYLDHPGGLPAKTIHGLIDAGVVIAGTLWPEEYNTRIAPRIPLQTDPHANDRELLRLAYVVDVPDTFTLSERGRAVRLAATDQRIKIALDSSDVGITQVLAAGPQLIRRWENAPADHCYGKALITAALDARRVGAYAPLTADYFDEAVPSYLTSAQRATAPTDWLDRAIRYATEPVHGAAACLTPVAAGMSKIAGYITADYLFQHSRTVRRTEPTPEVVWQALIKHNARDDALRLAASATPAYPRYAEILYSRLAKAGDGYAIVNLVELLIAQGREDDLRRHAAEGMGYAERRLTEALLGQGRLDEAIALTRQRISAGDRTAAVKLVELLGQAGRVSDLRKQADTGDGYAAAVLVELLARSGSIDQAIVVATRRAAAGDAYPAVRMARMLAQHGQPDLAISALRRSVDSSNPYADIVINEISGEAGKSP